MCLLISKIVISKVIKSIVISVNCNKLLSTRMKDKGWELDSNLKLGMTRQVFLPLCDGCKQITDKANNSILYYDFQVKHLMAKHNDDSKTTNIGAMEKHVFYI